jgi:hypothetical protein
VTGAHVQHGLGGPHPDDESIEFEMNAELDRDERREIDRRAEWYAQQRRERGWT